MARKAPMTRRPIGAMRQYHHHSMSAIFFPNSDVGGVRSTERSMWSVLVRFLMTSWTKNACSRFRLYCISVISISKMALKSRRWTPARRPRVMFSSSIADSSGVM
eukprot:Amastigsp_a508575_51.p4 type:complete len:105 gc:universal Amastigsp_a508575_51:903-1217(+)